ncbi:MAG: arginase family protein, partial [Planctomycetota bacterium]
MQIVHNAKHVRHAPSYAFARGRQRPHDDAPTRAERILEATREAGFAIVPPRTYDLDTLRSVHTSDYVEYLRGAYEAWVADGMCPAGVIPGTFPVRTLSQMPAELSGQAGWYCIDTETPIGEHTFEVARASASCALSGADLLLEGEPSAYALCRPPGHHAGRDYCGGYCYLNNAALAAARLLAESDGRSKVLILDVDGHHGNGT